MKKVLMSVVILFAFALQASADFTGGGSAGSDEDKYRPSMGRTVLGTVTSIDEQKGDINVLDEAKHYEITIHLRSEDRHKVGVGDRVKILTQPNTNVARTIIQQKPLEK